MKPQGTAFPFKIEGNGKIATSSGKKHIRGCIVQILGTGIGERMMRPNFGSRLNELIFETFSPLLEGLIKHYVKNALKKWEKRIQLIEVRSYIDTNIQNQTNVIVEYRITATGELDNVVFPMKLNHST